MTPQPPTIAHLKGHGLEGLFVTCANAACQHSVPFTFAALGLEAARARRDRPAQEAIGALEPLGERARILREAARFAVARKS
jgi:hypothetical protein